MSATSTAEATSTTASAAYSAVSAAWFTTIAASGATGGTLSTAGAGAPMVDTDGDGVPDTDIGTSNSADASEWIVRLTASALETVHSVAEAAERFRVDELGLTVIAGLGLPGQLLLRATGASADVQAYLAGNDSFAYWQANQDVVLQATPNDPSYSSLYGLHNTGQTGGTTDADIDAPEAWNISTGSRSIVVGVIDTGIDYNHPDLAANIWTNPGEIAGDGIDNDGNGFVDDVHGYDFANNDGDPMDDHYHGTHVAGTIGGVGNNGVGVAGVNWAVTMMGLKFIKSSGTGSTSDAVRAVNYATMMRTTYGVNVRLTSNSWGGGAGFNQPLLDAINAGGAADILFVAAAGNDATNNDLVTFYPASYDSPYVVSVAATDSRDALSGFSNYGLTSVDLGAPGSSVYSTAPGNTYRTLSGTSMATPHVAGAAALALSVDPTLTAAQLKTALLATVDPVASLAGKTVTGGRLNANNLLQYLQLHVSATTPAVGSFVGTPPVSFAVDFSHVFDPSSVAAGDFKVNGIAADGFTIDDTDTITFTFNTSPVTAQGLQTMTMAGGALSRLSDGGASNAFTGTFRYDVLRMDVTGVTPAAGSVVTLPLTTLDVEFNEGVLASSVQAGDLAVSQGSVVGASLLNATTVRYTLSGLITEGTYSFSIAAGALTDSFGNANLAYGGNFTLDYATFALPTTTLVGQAPSMAYQTSFTGTIAAGGDEDRLTLAIDAGQRLTVQLDAAAGLTATIEVRDPADGLMATATAAGAGLDLVLQNLAIGTTGTYTIVVRGSGGSAGAYTVNVLLNSAVEDENHDGPTNGLVATAQSLDGALVSVGGTAARAAVGGRIASSSDQDYYSVTLAAGQSLAASVQATTGSPPVLRFVDGAGNGLAQGVLNGTARTQEIVDFTAATGGTYYLVVSAAAGLDYQLLVGRDLAFDRLGNNAIATAQSLTSVAGALAGAVEGSAGLGRLFVFDNATSLISELNPSTGAVLRSFASPVAVATGIDFGMATTPTTLLVAGISSAAIYELNPDTGAVIRTIGASGTSVSGLAYRNGEIFVRSDTNSTVTVRNYTTGAVLRTFTIGSSSESLAAGTDYLYATNGQTLLTIDPQTGATVSSRSLGGGVIEGLGVIGNELFAASGGTVTVFDRTTFAVLRTLTGFGDLEGVGADGGPASISDYYRVTLSAGTPFLATTSTPADGTGQFVNPFDAKLLLYDAAGNLVASDDNSAVDGRNANLIYLPAAGGTYYLAVAPSSPFNPQTSHGEYVLNYSGLASGAAPFAVASIDPPAGASLTAQTVSQVTVTFGDYVLLSSLAASDLRLDGVSAASFALIDGKTVRFTLTTPVSAGSHTITIAAGAISDVQGTALAAHSSTFSIDDAAPRVVGTSIQEGGVATAGDLTYVVTFDEAMRTSNLDASDFTLHGNLRNVNYTASSFSFDAAGKVLTIGYTALPEDSYVLVLTSGDGRFEDTSGNDLDGEPTTPIPPGRSGNGVSGGDYLLNFSLDGAAPTAIPALVAVTPAGSLVYQSAAPLVAALSAAGDVDELTLALDAGQTLTLLVTATRDLRTALEIYGPSDVLLGSFAASVRGGVLAAQTLAVTAAGIYKLRLSGADGTVGLASASVTLNAYVESERFGGAANNTIAEALSIDASFLALGGVASRGAVVGTVDVPVSGTVTLTAADSGWYDETGKHTSTNTNYIVGRSSNAKHNFFVFDLSGIAYSIVGAQLQIGNPSNGYSSPDASETYAVYDVSTSITALTAGGNGLLGVYNDLAGGVTYGSQTVTSASNGQIVGVTLNGAALEMLNRERGGQVAFGGALTSLTGTTQQFVFGSSAGTFVRQLVLTYGPPTPDFYSFSLAAGEKVSIGLEELSGTGATLTLYDAAGNVLATGAAGGSSFDRWIDGFTAGSAGKYYLGVTSSAQVTYEIVVSRSTTFDNGANDTPATAQALAGNAAALGHVASGAGDYYSFTTATSGAIRLTTSTPGDGTGQPANGLNPALELYDAGGALVASNGDGAADGRNALLTYSAAAGTYRVRVVGTSGQGEYVLSLERATGPSISGVADVMVVEDGTASLSFSVTDSDTPASSLVVSALAADGSFVPASGLTLTDLGGGNYRLDIAPAADRFGSTGVTILVSDGTSTAGRTFTLNVSAANDRPSFSSGGDVSVNRFAGPQLQSGWAAAISAGPYEAAQGLEFLVSTDNPALFLVPPAIAADGTLSYAPAGLLGTATVTVRIRDAGGALSEPQTFRITVDNTTPTFAGLDPTFDGDGIVTLASFLGSKDVARDVARQADGKLVVVGSWLPWGAATFGSSAVARFNADGTLDTTFGSGGTIYFGDNVQLFGVEILQDGRILLGGQGPSNVYMAVRLLANGAFDTSYGVGGIATASSSFSGSGSVGSESAVTVQADGKLIISRGGPVAGQPAAPHLYAVRFTTSGALDSTFGSGGRVSVVLSGTTTSTPIDATVQSDGKIVIVGSATVAGSPDFFAARFNADGTLDTSFGGGTGSVTVSFGTTDTANRVVLQADGKIVVGGLAAAGDFGLVRLLSDGTLDTSFDGDGKATTSFGGTEAVLALAVQGDQKIVAAGYTSTGGNDFAVARYLTDGTLDISFDGDGRRTQAVGTGSDQIYGLLIDDAQKIVAVGTAADATNGGNFALARFLNDGALDLSFNGTGTNQLGLGSGSARVKATTVQPDGRIVAAGFLSSSSNLVGRRILWRFNVDGSLDATFGTGGVVLGPTTVSSNPSTIFVLGDGKILLIDDNNIVRFTSSGALDASFGTNGTATLTSTIGGSNRGALLPDGRILVVDSKTVGPSQDFVVARLNPNGSVDTSFDGDGWVSMDMGGTDIPQSVAVQADGKIVVGGSNGGDFAIARFNADGTPDLTFSDDGKVVLNGGGSDNVSVVLIQQDGKIVIGGRTSGDISIMRVLADGTLDTSFGGGDGQYLGPITSIPFDEIVHMIQQPDGKLLAVGQMTIGTVSQFYVARFLLDGTLDTTFDGDDGVLLTEVGATANGASSATLQADGRLVVGGFASRDGRVDAAVLRFRTGAAGGPTPSVAPLSDVTVRPSVAPAAIEFDVTHPVLPAGELTVAVASGDNAVVPSESLTLTNLGNGRWRLEIAASAAVGTSTITVTVSDGTSTYAEAFALNVVPPARVVGVYGRGSQWTDSFLNYLSSSGLGHASAASLGYLLSNGGNQLKPLPWASVDTITLEFDRAVPVSETDLTLVGSRDAAPPPAIASFAWDPDRFTATWTFAGALSPNKYLLHLNPVLVNGDTLAGFAGGAGGAGDVGAGLSGVGPAAAEFNFRFNALPGDVDGSASVAFGEIGQMRLKLGLTVGSAGYDPRQDWDGSGSITFADVGQARLTLGTSYATYAEPEPPIVTGGILSAGASASVTTVETFVAAGVETVGPESVATLAMEPVLSVVEASSAVSFASVTFVAATMRDDVTFRTRDLFRPTEDRSAPVTIAARFERLSGSAPAVAATVETEPAVALRTLATDESRLRIGGTHLNWRRLRRAAAAEPVGGRWGLAGGE